MLALSLYLFATLVALVWVAVDNNAIAAFEIFKRYLHSTARDMGMYREWLVQQLLRATLLLSCVIVGSVAATWMWLHNAWDLGWLGRTSLFAIMLACSIALLAMPHLSAHLRLKQFLNYKAGELAGFVSAISTIEGVRQHLELAEQGAFDGEDGWTAWHPRQERWNEEPFWEGLTPVVYLHQHAEAVDLSSEPDHIFELYGDDAREPGTYAANCLQARRLAERGVRFIQLYHKGWDHHGGLPKALPDLCRATDQASAALVTDLKQRGMLDDTLVIWAGEFGRTNYCQGRLTANDFGRDHHPKCFTAWMAGGGAKAGYTHGSTDEFCYNIAEKPVSVFDFNATMMHLLGIDHERLTYRYQGRDFRLTDVEGEVIHDMLA